MTSRGTIDGTAAAFDGRLGWQSEAVVPISTRAGSGESEGFEFGDALAGVVVVDVNGNGGVSVELKAGDGSVVASGEADGSGLVLTVAEPEPGAYRAAWSVDGSATFGVSTLAIQRR